MQSTQWYPLPEVKSDDEKSWWRETDHKTNISITDLRENTTLSLQADTSCATPNTTVQDHTSQADLTITSLLTLSPPRHSPSTQASPRPSSEASVISTSQKSRRKHDTHSQSTASKQTHPTQSLGLKSQPYYESILSNSEQSPTTTTSSKNDNTPNSQCTLRSVATTPVVASTDLSHQTNTPHVQQASLLELDKLWHMFLTSSLLGKSKENVLEMKTRCTCGAQIREPNSKKASSKHERTNKKRSPSKTVRVDEKRTPSNSVRTENYSRPPRSRKVDKTTATSPHSLETKSLSVENSPPINGSPKLIDRSVQTYSDAMPCPTPVRKPPTTFTIPLTQAPHTKPQPHKQLTPKPSTSFSIPPPRRVNETKTGSTGLQTWYSTPNSSLPETKSSKTGLTSTSSATTCDAYQTKAGLTCFPVTSESCQTGLDGIHPLSLSEAFALRCPEFIVHSQRREKRVRQMGEIRLEKVSTRPLVLEGRGRARQGPIYPMSTHSNTTAPSHYLLTRYGTRPRVSHRKMYLATKKAWESLPEVKRKVEEERKRSQAETNRLRVKLYQKEVLTRMRKRTSNRQLGK